MYSLSKTTVIVSDSARSNAKLHAFDSAEAALLPLLEGEALSLCRMYEGA